MRSSEVKGYRKHLTTKKQLISFNKGVWNFHTAFCNCNDQQVHE